MIKNEKLIISIHENAKRATKQMAANEWEFILILHDVIKYEVYRGYTYPSLQKYLILAHGFSEDRAYDFATVAKATLKFKKLETALANSKINISKARRIVPVLNQDNQEEWLHKAHVNSQRGLERLVAGKNPEVSFGESARYISENQVEMKQIVTVKEYQEFQRAQDLECQKQKRPVSMKSTMVQANKAYLEKHDPVIKAIKHQEKELKKKVKQSKMAKTSGTCRKNRATGSTAARKSISMPITHKLNLRDKGECQELLPNGQKC